MSSLRPPTIDPQAAQRWASRDVQASPWLHEEVARRMAERLDLILFSPTQWLHWAPLQGGLAIHPDIVRRYPAAQCLLVEPLPARQETVRRALAQPWWQWAKRQPRPQFGQPAPGAAQLVWANMGLHLEPDPQALIQQWHGALAQDGFLMFSCLGPDTLIELRTLYAELGWPEPSHAFTDMHDWGDMLVHAGFAEPVMDMERITLTFATPERLLAELRTLGRNLHVGRFSALRGRGWHAKLLAALDQRLRRGDQLALSFEIIYGHAFKPAPRAQVSEQTAVSLDAMRSMLRGANRPLR